MRKWSCNGNASGPGRHAHVLAGLIHQWGQPRFPAALLETLQPLAPALLELACQQITLGAAPAVAAPVESSMQERLLELQPALTPREVEVCTRLLQGIKFDGIACDLGLGVPSVKTYRNRAFERLGIHFRNELFALMLRAPAMAVTRN